jgi:hypothetical protein
MRRARHITAAVVMAALAAHAAPPQSVIDTSSATNVYVGVKAGLVLSTMWGPGQPKAGTVVEDVINSFVPAISGGVNVPVVLHDNFILESELLFSIRGMRWSDSLDQQLEGNEEQYRRWHYYIDVPVIAKLVLFKKWRLKPVLYLGPQFSLNIASYLRKKGSSGDASYSSRWWTLRDSSSYLDFAVVGGLCVHIRAGRGFFIVDARGALGLPDQESTDRTILRNIYATGYISYCFNPRRRRSLW